MTIVSPNEVAIWECQQLEAEGIDYAIVTSPDTNYVDIELSDRHFLIFMDAIETYANPDSYLVSVTDIENLVRNPTAHPPLLRLDGAIIELESTSGILQTWTLETAEMDEPLHLEWNTYSNQGAITWDGETEYTRAKSPQGAIYRLLRELNTLKD